MDCYECSTSDLGLRHDGYEYYRCGVTAKCPADAAIKALNLYHELKSMSNARKDIEEQLRKEGM